MWIILRNGYVIEMKWYNILARVKAVELRQKNRDELLAEIENYKKELSQVSIGIHFIYSNSFVLLKLLVELLLSFLKLRLFVRTLLVLLLFWVNKRELLFVFSVFLSFCSSRNITLMLSLFPLIFVWRRLVLCAVLLLRNKYASIKIFYFIGC